MSATLILLAAFWGSAAVVGSFVIAVYPDSGLVSYYPTEYLLDSGAFYLANVHVLPRYKLRALAALYAYAALAGIAYLLGSTVCRCRSGRDPDSGAGSRSNRNSSRGNTNAMGGVPTSNIGGGGGGGGGGANAGGGDDDPAPVRWNEQAKCFEVSSADLIRSTLDRFDGKPGGLTANFLPSVRAQLTAAARGTYGPLLRFLGAQVIFLDGPPQQVLHGVLRGFLSAARLDRLRAEWLPGAVDGLLDSCVAAGAADSWEGSSFDFLRDFAALLPIRTMLHLAGLPQGEEQRVRAWSDTIERWYGASGDGMDARCADAAAVIAEFREMVGPFVAAAKDSRRAGLGGGADGASATTLIDVLVHAAAEGRIAEDLVAPNIFFMLAAGYETTASLLSNGLVALLDHPEELRRVRDAVRGGGGVGSGQSQTRRRMAAVVNELMRYVSPIKRLYRQVTDNSSGGSSSSGSSSSGSSSSSSSSSGGGSDDTGTGSRKGGLTVGGLHMPPGALVHFIVTDANRRDRCLFQDPGVLRVQRRNAREHLGFGYGPHACAGAMLARLEAEVALTRVLQRFPSIALAGPRSALRWKALDSIVALETLLITVDEGEDDDGGGNDDDDDNEGNAGAGAAATQETKKRR